MVSPGAKGEAPSLPLTPATSHTLPQTVGQCSPHFLTTFQHKPGPEHVARFHLLERSFADL